MISAIVDALDEQGVLDMNPDDLTEMFNDLWSTLESYFDVATRMQMRIQMLQALADFEDIFIVEPDERIALDS
jgi:hypothetical protein